MTSYARNGDVTIAYERLGPADGEPLLLVQSPGTQFIAWPDGFCQVLVDRGFAVARFDGRDCGLSTRFDDAPTPSRLKLITQPSSASPYDLDDLADDAVTVLDALGWAAAHVVGQSYGGVVAQRITTRHPARVRSLTSISSTPSMKLGRPGLGTLRTILKVARRPVRSVEEYAQHHWDLQPLIATPTYPADEDEVRAVARRMYERGHDRAAVQRASGAVAASGDRRRELAGICVPTLVIHGSDDVMIRPAAARATAEAIPGARLRIHPGMGAGLPRPLWSAVGDEIGALAATGRTA